jgi:hypothetical protein
MNKMRPLPNMIADLRALAGLEVLRHHAELLDDAANYIEGASSSLREHMQMIREMRVRLENVRPLMEEAASVLEDVMIKGCDEEELPRAIRALLRWWEPGTAELASISHWVIVE